MTKLERATIADDEQPSKKRVLVLIDQIGAVDYHRIAMPLRYIYEKNIFHIDFAIQEKEVNEAKVEDYDIVIFSRYLLNMSIVDRCIAAKVKLIVDIDDYWNVPKYNPAYKQYKEKGKEAVLKSLKAASMVWTTTPQLAEKVKEINPNVHILPNYIDHNENQWLEKNDHPLTIGYVGGFSHLEDVKLLRGQIGDICEKYNARFLFCGYNSTDPNSAEMEYQITGSRQRPDWFWVGEVTSVLNYGKYYSHIDVVLAPLTETHFNKHKSELKIVEAAAYKLPILVSEVEPYTNHRDNEGVTFVKNNDWSIIGEVIKNRKELGEKNYKYCLEHHNIETINQKRISLIYQL